MEDKPKKLPWGLKPESLAPCSLKTLPDSKLKAFQMGRNPLKVTKVSSKLKEEEKKKAEEAATAEVYAEYIESFQNSAQIGKAFVRGSVVNADEEINEKTAHKYQKNTSKLAELAEEFKKTKEPVEITSKTELKKKKEKDKKKSNLELFKEELERSQKEREIRHKIKKGDISGIPDSVLTNLPSSFFNSSGNNHSSNRHGSSHRDSHKPDDDDDSGNRYGSLDNGDPNTTNLYIGNINPKVTEEQLCKLFGKFGPLASVKIMWPRTDEEKARNRNCGFVAYMNRADGERALNALAGKDVFDYEMRLGWGKCVPIPPQPLYVPPEMIEAQKPPPQSGLPFNGQISSKFERDNKQFDGNLENTIVKVVTPMERSQLAIIHRMVEFVAREGPMFEAMIMNKELNNPLFRFLFDNKSHEHIYYRWRLFSILQGDTPQKWSESEFRMFKGGSIWRPPPMNRFSMISLQPSSQNLASVSSAIAHASTSTVLPKQEKIEIEQPVKKEMLSDSQRDKLEDSLRTVNTDRKKIGEIMVWCLDHADFADEIVECITESLSLLETPIQTKIARLYIVSDILHNSATKVHHASHFRRGFEKKLNEIMEHLRSALVSASSKAQAEKFRKQVLSCLAAWQDWSIYSPGYLINLQNVFVGLSDKKVGDVDGFPLSKDTNIDGQPLEKDDVDGIPLNLNNDYLDGFPLVKDHDHDDGGDNDDDDDNVDGVPISQNSNNMKNRAKSSRWELVETESTKKKPRGENVDQKSQTKIPKSKWEEDETDENEAESKWINEKTAKSKWQQVGDPSNKGTSNKEQHGESKSSEIDELRRKLLRDVELKVMKYADKLEATGLSKSERTVQNELEKYRQHLIEDYDRERRKKSKERKRGRSVSSSPLRTPIRNQTSPRRKKSHLSKSHSRSPTSSESDTSDESKSSRKIRERKKERRSRSRSISPTTPRRTSKKKKKKSRK